MLQRSSPFGFESFTKGSIRSLGIFLVAWIVAMAGTSSRCGSWYDLSRIATVESLVDRGTWIIDDSFFHQPRLHPEPQSFLAASSYEILLQGTRDKVRVGDHYYSDKSPTPALVMAGIYQALQSGFGLDARESPATFIFWMTFLTSGLAFAIAVWGMDRVIAHCGIAGRQRDWLLVFFALGTIALPYAQAISNHIILLPVCVLIILTMQKIRSSHNESVMHVIPIIHLMILGCLVGLGYSIDLGMGPVLILATSIWLMVTIRRPWPLLVFWMGALPPMMVHHVLNYSIGGTIQPVNAIPEYLNWPGSPFDTTSMTGVWHHDSLGSFLLYGFDLLFGKKGFFGHNLPLYLLPSAVLFLCWKPMRDRIDLWFCLALIIGTWMMYALLSNNHSGMCLSVRWFVPLLAPAWWILARFLTQYPHYFWSVATVGIWGLVLGAIMSLRGPWIMRMVPMYWPIQGAAFITWLIVGYRWWKNVNTQRLSGSTPMDERTQQAA